MHLLQSKTFEKVPTEGDDFNVKIRVVGSKDFNADLVKLSVTTTLWTFVSEVRSGVPNFPGRGGTVLNKSTAHAGGLFWSEGNMSFALIDEVVHLFRHDVGCFADPMKDTDVFK